MGPGTRGVKAGPGAGMAAGPLGSEDLLCSWDRLVWGLTSRVLRTCRGGHLRVLQLMLKPWCISRAVYQVGPEALLTFLCSIRNQPVMVGKEYKLLSHVEYYEVCCNGGGGADINRASSFRYWAP